LKYIKAPIESKPLAISRDSNTCILEIYCNLDAVSKVMILATSGTK